VIEEKERSQIAAEQARVRAEQAQATMAVRVQECTAMLQQFRIEVQREIQNCVKKGTYLTETLTKDNEGYDRVHHHKHKINLTGSALL
jgi:hypothetical protein